MDCQLCNKKIEDENRPICICDECVANKDVIEELLVSISKIDLNKLFNAPKTYKVLKVGYDGTR